MVFTYVRVYLTYMLGYNMDCPVTFCFFQLNSWLNALIHMAQLPTASIGAAGQLLHSVPIH